MQKQVFIVDGIRTPIGNFKGSLAAVRPDDMAALVIRQLMERNTQVPAHAVEEVIMGCANQAGEDNRNVARMASLLAGLPVTVGAETVNRLCASGMSAVVQATRAIRCDEGEIYIAGGVESMTRAPWVLSKASSPFGQDQQMYDSSFGWRFINPQLQALYGTDAMGNTAENVAKEYGINREDQDRFAYYSQWKAAKAQAAGIFAEEITPVTIPQRKGEPTIVDTDEFLKPGTTMDVLKTLRPAFLKEGGTVTAGNSSGLNDGACALLLASEAAVKQYGLNPLARVLGAASVGVEPRIMGIGPVAASRKALERSGFNMAYVDVIELNEAFAAQSLACLRLWGLDDDDSRLNPNGGAIALGHPLGMSGARIVLSAARQLQRTQGRLALATMCIGVGQGFAVVLGRV